MEQIDLKDNLQIAILMEMLEDVSRAASPLEARAAFGRRLGTLRQMDLFVAISVRNLEPGQYKITRFIKGGEAIGGSRGLGSDDPWHQWDALRTNTGGLIGRLIEQPDPKLIHNLDISGDPVLGSVADGMGSCVAIPLLDGGRALNWAFHFRRARDGFTPTELADFLLTDNLVGAMTRSLVGLDQIRSLNARLREQFEQIARVQQALLPAQVPSIPGVSIATSYLTSEQAGGDYYDFFDLGSGRWGILIADVSGHGPGAATVMAMLHAILHTYPDLNDGPAAALRFANKKLCESRTEAAFTTAIFAVFDRYSRDLTISRAGHPLPLLKTGTELSEIDGPSSFPLGIEERAEISQYTVRLHPGQTVVFYTDGITEVFNASRQMFGVAGLTKAVRSSSCKPDDVIDAIHRDLYEYTGLRTRDDDQTIVVMQMEGLPGGTSRTR